jgi:hypothetical protein
MTSIHDTTHIEILRKLQKLTNASNLASHGDHVVMRDLGVSAYMLTYDWLMSHGVDFTYDHALCCYVEVSNGD